MKKSWILLIVGMLLLSSCVTQKACDRKFPPQVTTIVKDSVVTRDSIVEKLVEVPVYIKGDTIIKSDTVWRDKTTGLANSKPVYAETDFAKATAQVKDGKINLTLIQKDSLFRVQVLARESYFWKEKYFKEKSKEVKIIKVVPKYYSIMSTIGIISLILLVAYIIFKIRGRLL